MRYKVMKRAKKRPHRWEPSSEHDDYPAAELAARKLCPRGVKVYTEPGKELPRQFFGSEQSLGWSAMIEVEP